MLLEVLHWIDHVHGLPYNVCAVPVVPVSV